MRRARLQAGLVLCLLVMILPSCQTLPGYSHVNVSISDPDRPSPDLSSTDYIASVDVRYDLNWRCRNAWSGSPPERSIDKCLDASRRDPNFIALALSGGGSRAAVFSAAVMFELQKRGILQQVDVVSSVSGGSVAAALYAVSCDDAQDCPATVTPSLRRTLWKESDVYPLLQKDFIDRWRINCWRPSNIVRYMSYFDRTDVMAETFAETLFGGTRDTRESFLFRDLNPRRPYLILNSTINTDSVDVPEIFTFTGKGFAGIGSRLDLFPVSYGVTGSAAFPGAFHYLTLRDYSIGGAEQYMHLMDGGVTDNLGLESLKRILKGNAYRDARVLVILADVRTLHPKSAADPDPRTFSDYLVDFSNLSDAYSLIMLEVQRTRVADFRRFLAERQDGSMLIHLNFQGLKLQHEDLYKAVNDVPTNFKICDEQALNLRKAAEILVGKAVEELRGNAYWRDIVN